MQFFSTNAVKASEVAKLISHPARIEIVHLLREKKICVPSGVIVAEIPLGRSTVLQHLTVLKDAGWVKGTLDGSHIHYCLDAQKIHQDLEFLSTITSDIEDVEPISCLTPNEKKEKVLFLCIGNSCRSQMAEAFFNHYGNNTGMVGMSAGTVPAKEVHPLAIKVMNELGIEMVGQSPKNADIFRGENSPSLVLFVCSQAEEDCPYLFPHARRTISMPFEDPAAFEGNEQNTLEHFRKIRDQIKDKIIQLVTELS